MSGTWRGTSSLSSLWVTMSKGCAVCLRQQMQDVLTTAGQLYPSCPYNCAFSAPLRSWPCTCQRYLGSYTGEALPVQLFCPALLQFKATYWAGLNRQLPPPAPPPPPPPIQPPAPPLGSANNQGLSAGVIAAIAVGSTVLLVLLAAGGLLFGKVRQVL